MNWYYITISKHISIKAKDLEQLEKKLKKIKSVKIDEHDHFEIADYFDNIIEFKLHEGLKLSLIEKYRYRKIVKEKYQDVI